MINRIHKFIFINTKKTTTTRNTKCIVQAESKHTTPILKSKKVNIQQNIVGPISSSVSRTHVYIDASPSTRKDR